MSYKIGGPLDFMSDLNVVCGWKNHELLVMTILTYNRLTAGLHVSIHGSSSHRRHSDHSYNQDYRFHKIDL